MANKTLYRGLDHYVHHNKGKIKRFFRNDKKLFNLAQASYQDSLRLASLFDDELQAQVNELRIHFRRHKHLDTSTLQRALALIAELANRTLNMRPYEVQIMGALAIYNGFAIEMLPGEGKTITAAMGAILSGWHGYITHIVTSNDYLAKRDALLMQPLFGKCGLSVGYVEASMQQDERRQNYAYAITYSTSKELLADYLRDQMIDTYQSKLLSLIQTLKQSSQSSSKVMRGLHTAIIDEADSVLGDEAVTPLIISVPVENQLLKEVVFFVKTLTDRLELNRDYTKNPLHHKITLTEQGWNALDENIHLIPSMWRSRQRLLFLIEQALIAREYYIKDKHYAVLEDEIVIVDEKTGRLMYGKSWSNGLHQAIEAKEGIPLTDPTETHTRMSFQRFFRLYEHLSGMSGTLQHIEDELWDIYHLQTIKIPTRLKRQLLIQKEFIFRTKEEKYQKVIDFILQMHQSSRPVLVGTRSIQESELLSQMLARHGLSCFTLNALHHEEESEIIAQAGQKERITIATNMAGRGTDILIDSSIASLGGLHVIATQKHESIRIDLQLFGRSARQGQLGSAQAILSLEDELIEYYAPFWLKKLFAYLPINAMTVAIFNWLQYRAEKKSSSIRKKILEQDFSLNEMLSFSKDSTNS